MLKLLKRFEDNWQRNKAYRKTYDELSKLSDKELDDIGINRGMIRSIAMETHFDNLEDNKNLKGWV